MLKKISIIVSAILTLIALAVDIWYLYILLVGGEKVVSKTFEVGALTLADGTSKDIIEIEYFKNVDNSGYEAFEIKFNYFVDETKVNVFSQGLQFIAKTGSVGIELAHNDLFVSDKIESEGALGWKDKYYNCQNSYMPTVNTSVYNYMSIDDTYLKSTNPLNLQSYFKIDIGEDIYLMQFKGLDTPQNENTYFGTECVYHNIWVADKWHNKYYVYDVNYFAKLLYESVKTADLGANQNIVFEFGNLFNYYAYDEETGVYNENKTDFEDVLKISGDIKSYYSIRVKTHEYGLSRSQDSMFGSILGNQNFNLNGDSSGEDYFIGKTVIDCNISSFDFVTIEGNNIALKLKESFLNYYEKYKNLIKLSVIIDLDLLNELGYTFVGFTADSGLDNFMLYKCCTMSNNEVVTDYLSGGELCLIY